MHAATVVRQGGRGPLRRDITELEEVEEGAMGTPWGGGSHPGSGNSTPKGSGAGPGLARGRNHQEAPVAGAARSPQGGDRRQPLFSHREPRGSTGGLGPSACSGRATGRASNPLGQSLPKRMRTSIFLGLDGISPPPCPPRHPSRGAPRAPGPAPRGCPHPIPHSTPCKPQPRPWVPGRAGVGTAGSRGSHSGLWVRFAGS